MWRFTHVVWRGMTHNNTFVWVLTPIHVLLILYITHNKLFLYRLLCNSVTVLSYRPCPALLCAHNWISRRNYEEISLKNATEGITIISESEIDILGNRVYSYLLYSCGSYQCGSWTTCETKKIKRTDDTHTDLYTHLLTTHTYLRTYTHTQFTCTIPVRACSMYVLTLSC